MAIYDSEGFFLSQKIAVKYPTVLYLPARAHRRTSDRRVSHAAESKGSWAKPLEIGSFEHLLRPITRWQIIEHASLCELHLEPPLGNRFIINSSIFPRTSTTLINNERHVHGNAHLAKV